MPASGHKGVSWNHRMKAWLTFYYDDKVRRSRTFHPKNFNNDIEKSLLAAIEFAKTVNTGPRSSAQNHKTTIKKNINKRANTFKHISKISSENSDQIKTLPRSSFFNRNTNQTDPVKTDYKNNPLEDLTVDVVTNQWVKTSLLPKFPIPTLDLMKKEFICIGDLLSYNSEDIQQKLFFSYNDTENLNTPKTTNNELNRQLSSHMMPGFEFYQDKRDIFTFDLGHINHTFNSIGTNKYNDYETNHLLYRNMNSNEFLLNLMDPQQLKSYSSFTSALILRQGSSDENLYFYFPELFM